MILFVESILYEVNVCLRSLLYLATSASFERIL